MWNMDFVIPSLLVLAVLLIFYFARPRLPNQLNRAFLFLLVSDIATIVTDFLATCADNAYHSRDMLYHVGRLRDSRVIEHLRCK